MEEKTITLKKSTFDIMCNLLSLAAVGGSITLERIGRDSEMMKDMKYKNADYFNTRITESTNDGFKITNLLFKAIPSDCGEVLSHFDDVGHSIEYKKLLKYYSADLVANGNFDNLENIED